MVIIHILCWKHTCILWSSLSFCFNADCNQSTAEADVSDPNPVEYPSIDIDQS